MVMNYEDESNDIGLNNFLNMGLWFLIERCPRLKSLFLVWYYAMSSHSLVILKSTCKGFKILDLQVYNHVYNYTSIFLSMCIIVVLSYYKMKIVIYNFYFLYLFVANLLSCLYDK